MADDEWGKRRPSDSEVSKLFDYDESGYIPWREIERELVRARAREAALEKKVRALEKKLAEYKVTFAWADRK